METMHKILSWLVITAVGLVTMAVELPIKLIGFVTFFAIYMVLMLFAPLTCKYRNVTWFDKMWDWAFSPQFNWTNKVVTAYYRALL